jgi:hypothetical protein
MKKVLVVLLTLTIFGCAGVADSLDKATGVAQLTSDLDFEGNYQAVVTPTYLNDGGTFNNTVHMGAYYNESVPESVVLSLLYSASTNSSAIYTSIDSISIKIDGQVNSFDTNGTDLKHDGWNTVSKSIFTESESTVVIPFSLFEKMITSKNCDLRIYTGDGYESADFTIERNTGQALAKLAFVKLYKEIEKHKKL